MQENEGEEEKYLLLFLILILSFEVTALLLLLPALEYRAVAPKNLQESRIDTKKN